MQVVSTLMDLWDSFIGAVVGGGIAGLCSFLAIKAQLASERRIREAEATAELNATIASLYHELKTVWGLYLLGIGKTMEDFDGKTLFPWTAPMTSNYYVIYQASAEKIGLIPNPALRDSVISAYTYAAALKDSYILNNELHIEATNAQTAHRLYGTDGTKHVLEEKLRRLDLYGAVLKDAHEKTKKQANDCIYELRKYQDKLAQQS